MTIEQSTPNGSLRIPASLLLVGQVSYIGVTQFHAGGDANHHETIFAVYSGDSLWMVVHVGQFAGMVLLLGGLLALALALNVRGGMARWVGGLGTAAVATTLALYGVLQAIDGVALKHAVDAWMAAPETERAARFSSAEAVRWLEWGLRSYQDFALGLALTLFATLVFFTMRGCRER